MAIADDQPNRSANDAAIVRRSDVLATSPMRSSKAWNRPVPASRRSVPWIQPDSAVVMGSLGAHPHNTCRTPARADRERCRTSRTRSNRRASGGSPSGRRCTRRGHADVGRHRLLASRTAMRARDQRCAEWPPALTQISRRSLPTMTVPRKCVRAASSHIWSVIAGSSGGTKCESTSVFTPAACATRPASSAVV